MVPVLCYFVSFVGTSKLKAKNR